MQPGTKELQEATVFVICDGGRGMRNPAKGFTRSVELLTTIMPCQEPTLRKVVNNENQDLCY